MATKRKDDPPPADLFGAGTRVLSVFGPFNSRTLVEMPTETALEIFGPDLAAAGRTDVVEAVEADLAEIRERAPRVADSALAASAVSMAYELVDPYNSATSKSMCAKVLREAMDRLIELAPPEEKPKGELYDIKSSRARRLTPG